MNKFINAFTQGFFNILTPRKSRQPNFTDDQIFDEIIEEHESQSINDNPIYEMFDYVKDKEFDFVEKWVRLYASQKLDRELLEEEKDIINIALIVGMTYGVSDYRNEIKKNMKWQ